MPRDASNLPEHVSTLRSERERATGTILAHSADSGRSGFSRFLLIVLTSLFSLSAPFCADVGLAVAYAMA